jgi:hypothetical protein
MKESLSDFLNGNSQKLLAHKVSFEESDSCDYFVKVDSGKENIKLIYKISSDIEGVLPIFRDMTFLGIFSKPKKTFYHSYFPEYYDECLDFSNLRLLKIGELYKELEKKIKTSLVNKVGYDENFLKPKIKSEEIGKISKSEVKRKAFELFMRNKEVDKYEYADFFSLPKIEYSQSLLLFYLDNPDKTVKKKTNQIINDSCKIIYKNIVINKLVEKELENMNKDKSLHKKREIASILSDVSRKTLNLEFEKNKKTLECKIETSLRYLNQSYIWSMSILSLSDRQKFEEMFADTNDEASFDDIKKITYSRKTLFSSKR